MALVGQVPFKEAQVIVKNGKIWTHDQKPVGYLLASGNVYINFSSADHEQSQQIHEQSQQSLRQAREIASLKQENKELKLRLERENTELKQRLENLEKLLKK